RTLSSNAVPDHVHCPSTRTGRRIRLPSTAPCPNRRSSTTTPPRESIASFSSSRRPASWKPSSCSTITRTSPKQSVHDEFPANLPRPLDGAPTRWLGGSAANALGSATERFGLGGTRREPTPHHEGGWNRR